MELKGLYQKTDSRVWYYQGPQVNGMRPKPISLGTKDKEEAIREYLRIKPQVEGAMQAGKASLELRRYLLEKKRSRKHGESAGENSRSMVGLFIDHAGDRVVQAYSLADIEDWRDALFEEGRSLSTVQTYMSRVRSFFGWCVSQKLISANPVAELDLDRARVTRAHFYCRKEERDRFVQAADDLVREASPARRGLREDLQFFVWTGFFCGLRKNELVEARPDWFDLEAGVLSVQETETFRPKGKEKRQVRMSPRYLEWVKGYGLRGPFMMRPEKVKGKSLYRVDLKRPFLDLAGSLEGLEWMRPHHMRRTFATLQLLGGTPLYLVAKWLGDDEATTFRHYGGYVRSQGHEGAAD